MTEFRCATCADEGVPMRVLETGDVAICADQDGTRIEVLTDLVGPVEPGDLVLVHAGTALTRLDER